MYNIAVMIILIFLFITSSHALNCDELLIGQYKCAAPEIDIDTQSEKGCSKNETVLVECHLTDGISCDDAVDIENSTVFYKHVPCRYVNGKSFSTSLLLSIFLGMFGIDRFYLGYPAIGLFKFCTLGFFMIFQLIDIVLIATQVLQPADGSSYYMDYFGHRLIHMEKDNNTYWVLP